MHPTLLLLLGSLEKSVCIPDINGFYVVPEMKPIGKASKYHSLAFRYYNY